jgi:hypothetical protein
LGLSWDAVIELVKRGRLQGRLVGGRRWFIRTPAVERMARTTPRRREDDRAA